MRLLSSLVLSLLVFCSSCHFLGGERVTGNGRITRLEKKVGSFNSVKAMGSITVRIRQDAANSIQMETDENLMQYLDVYTDGNVLVIRSKKGYNLDPSKDIVAFVSAPGFRDIEVSGACDIFSDGVISGSEALDLHASGSSTISVEVNVPKLTTTASGSSDITVKGQVTDFSADMSGSGKLSGFELQADNTTLDLSGASDAEVTANKKLEVDAAGSSDVRYKGNATVDQHISGAGSVKKVG